MRRSKIQLSPSVLCKAANSITLLCYVLLLGTGAVSIPKPSVLFPLNERYGHQDISGNNVPSGPISNIYPYPGPYGTPGGSMYFKGEASSYMVIPKHANIDTRYSMTMILWVYPQGTRGPILEYTNPDNINWAVHLWFSTSTTLFIRFARRADNVLFDAIGKDVPISNWYYVAITYSYMSGIQSLYINGAKIAQLNIGIAEMATNYEITLGANSRSTDYFKGRIACLQIYNSELTGTEIELVKHICRNDGDPLPVAFYPFNELYETKEISGKGGPAGIVSNVQLSAGPYGRPGRSYSFAGSTSSFVEIPLSSSLDTRYSFAISLWVRHEGVAGPLFEFIRPDSAPFAVHIWMTESTTNLMLRMMQRNTFASADALNVVLQPNTWYHVVYTYDYWTGRQRFYRDGVMAIESYIGSIDIATNFKVRMGYNGGDPRCFKGQVSCIQVFREALDAAQVNRLRYTCNNMVFPERYGACVKTVPLDTSTRDQNNIVSGIPSDGRALNHVDWYRPSGDHAMILSRCPPAGSCGAQSPGWMNESHPRHEDGIVSRRLCYRVGGDCCARRAIVYVRQCNGYYVYKFEGLPPEYLDAKLCFEGHHLHTRDILFSQTTGQYFLQHVHYTETRVSSVASCLSYCLAAGTQCRSFNYKSTDQGTCQLNNATIAEYSNFAVSETGWDYYEPTSVITVQ
ncbi:uncharacterized protein LOC116619643 isoform X2 [Nematostella vectensis]|nr:uncharacterized protein LOC116619643 isoform X2 [Nematostella vectensis]